jgi:hypothetical protein
MLKTHASPVVTSKSPRFYPYQHGQSSPRITTHSATSRPYIAPEQSPSLAPTARKIHYVDRGTQWSPMVPKMEHPPVGESTPAKVKKSPLAENGAENETNFTTTQIQPPNPPTPSLQAASPSTKRREPPVDATPGTSSIQNQSLPARSVRLRPAQAPVKILSQRYELCQVEDIVILIADMISELIQRNDVLPLRQGVLTRYHSRLE